jgi:hypothetical protein
MMAIFPEYQKNLHQLPAREYTYVKIQDWEYWAIPEVKAPAELPSQALALPLKTCWL